MILGELDYEFAARAGKDVIEVAPNDILHLSDIRTSLLPLIAMEDALASEINGGVSIPGGRSGAYVRSGWQTILNQKQQHVKLPETATLAAKILSRVADEIRILWEHPTVQRYIEQRKIRVEDSAAL